MTGSGSGQVWLHSGTLFASPALVIAFPPNLFQWNGAILQGVITNTGTVTISGTNVSTLTGFNTTFVNLGTVQQTGSGGSLMGTFNVASGAVLDLTGGSAPTWSGEMTGSGSGQVWLHSGTLFASPALVIAFPPNLLQWNGAILQGNITNTGTVTISGTNVSTLTGGKAITK